MLSHNYSYQQCLDNSKKVAWKEDDVLVGKNFDFSKRFLPNRLSGVDNITCLNDNEKRQLDQIMGNAYCHIFAFVEEFIIPMVTQAALDGRLTGRKSGCARCCASPRKSSSIRSSFAARWLCSTKASARSAA